MYAWLSQLLVLSLAIGGGVLIRKTYERYTKWQEREQAKFAELERKEKEKSEVKEDVGFTSEEISPLSDFDWATVEPLKFRPFKPKFHLTMGLSNVQIEELIEMDKNYLSRLELRKGIMREHRDMVRQADPTITPAINELYTFLTSVYLPTRFPTMFSVTRNWRGLLNHVTEETLPLTPPKDPIETLELIGANLDEDFLFLDKSEDGDGYVLRGFVTCFPSGFNTREKLGLKLRDIHGPVPGYKEKLEKSIDRFFEKLEIGKCVRRVNWTITTDDRLFVPSGNHLYDGEEAKEEQIDIDETYLRCERQCLHRLPVTKALVFSFKTYLYPLSEIKEEGLGEELAQAIDGLKEGSVPEMHFYKRGVVWGEAVKEYLRS